VEISLKTIKKGKIKANKKQSTGVVAEVQRRISEIQKQALNFKVKEPFSVFLADFKSARSK